MRHPLFTLPTLTLGFARKVVGLRPPVDRPALWLRLCSISFHLLRRRRIAPNPTTSETYSCRKDVSPSQARPVSRQLQPEGEGRAPESAEPLPSTSAFPIPPARPALALPPLPPVPPSGAGGGCVEPDPAACL